MPWFMSLDQVAVSKLAEKNIYIIWQVQIYQLFCEANFLIASWSKYNSMAFARSLKLADDIGERILAIN